MAPYQCAIAGGGPAGMMLGYLLARAGLRVVVLEKHADFLRDFRGDTVHPSTLAVMDELGLLDDFLKRPHQEIHELYGLIGETTLGIADFAHVPGRCKFIALMPQWDFLNFLVEHGRKYPGFEVRMEAEVVGLVEGGLGVKTPQGRTEVLADLVVGADGRGSLVRQKAGLEVVDWGSPIDVLWFRLTKHPNDPPQTFGRIDRGHVLVMLDRDTYWQCAFVIPKGGFAGIQENGLPAFRTEIATLMPVLLDRVDELRTWDDVRLLTVKVDYLKHWSRPGLLCIGDSAHAMSPIGGVGINLAIQDAVAAANIIAEPLARGTLTPEDLERVQERREFPTHVTQWAQVQIQNRVITRVLGSKDDEGPLKPPWPVQLLDKFPALRRIPARLVGVGVRPEHVETKEADYGGAR